VKGDRLLLTNTNLGCTNNVDMYKCSFDFLGDDWLGLIPFATFKINGQYYTSKINDHQCTLPTVDKAQAIYIGVYGLSSDSSVQKRLPTNWVVLNINEGAYIPGATVPPNPPPALWEEYAAKVEELATAQKTKQDKLTFDNTPIDDSKNPVTSGGVKLYVDSQIANLESDKASKTDVYTKAEINSALIEKQDILTFDTAPLAGSVNPVTSGGVKSAINQAIAGIYKIKGSIDTSSLRYDTSIIKEIGDVYNLTDNSENVYNSRKLNLQGKYNYAGTSSAYITIDKYSSFYSFHTNDTLTIQYNNVEYGCVVSNTAGNEIFLTSPSINDAILSNVNITIIDYIDTVGMSVSVGDNILWTEYGWDKLAGNIDLSGYVKEEQMNTALATKPEKSTVYTKVESDGFLANKANNIDLRVLKTKSIPNTIISGYPIALTDQLANEELLSCRVYGNTGGVGDLVSTGEFAGKYKITVRSIGKNLWNMNSIVSTGDKFIKNNNDGTITVNEGGPFSPAQTLHEICPSLKVGDVITCTMRTTNASRDFIWFYTTTQHGWKNATTRTVTQEELDCCPAFYSGTMSIQIEYGTILTSYEDYKIPSEKTVYLNAPLMLDQHVDINGLKTIDSEINKIIALTSVSPSKIDIAYYQDINKVLTNLKNSILSQGGNV
ncbi:MAG: hypothetical protein RR263_02405, partial [Oscillospiraceae bacterium]